MRSLPGVEGGITVVARAMNRLTEVIRAQDVQFGFRAADAQQSFAAPRESAYCQGGPAVPPPWGSPESMTPCDRIG